MADRTPMSGQDVGRSAFKRGTFPRTAFKRGTFPVDRGPSTPTRAALAGE